MSNKFWSDPTVQPKRSFKFLLYMGEGDRQVPSWVAKKVTKPSFQISETPHKFLNHTFYFPGRLEWQTIDVTLADPVSPDASKITMDIINSSGYNNPETPEQAQVMINRADAIFALGNVRIEQIDSDGLVIEAWDLNNAWVKEVKYGELSYESDDMVNIDMVIRYDFATKDTTV
tara:strand:- start:1747 stop:2268 length:522 start_codon:yes stop_codon:yes gene_type:complete